MKTTLKPLSEQVVVLTGATSGIGLTTARAAAAAGAALVLAARNEDALNELASELRTQGARVEIVVADVGDEAQVQRIAEVAKEKFGGFDTWINNAGVGVYGTNEQIRREDMRRLFDTNFWGVVHGCMAALPTLKARGGALVTVGSITSDRSLPMQGIYGASKHAVKGFIDSLRTELEAAGAPVSVTLIKPGSIGTPFIRHAKNYMEVEPTYPGPVYAPEIVTDAILHAARHPVRDLYVGGGTRLMAAGAHHTPRLLDKAMEWLGIERQKSDIPASGDRDGNLYHPGADLNERAGTGRVRDHSYYMRAVSHPRTVMAIAAATGLLAAAAVGARRMGAGSRGAGARARR